MRSARELRRLRGVNHFRSRPMLAPIRPDTLLVKFLFTAPCLLAMLTVTCQREPEPGSSPSPDDGHAPDPQGTPATNAP